MSEQQETHPRPSIQELRDLRRDTGVNQADLADEIKIQKQLLSFIETKRTGLPYGMNFPHIYVNGLIEVLKNKILVVENFAAEHGIVLQEGKSEVIEQNNQTTQT